MACLSLASRKFPSSSPNCSLHSTKHLDRLLSSLASSPVDDPSTTNHIIRRFVSSSSKSTALQTLSLLLSQSSPLSLPMYQRISTTPWFQWNPKLTAQLISVLECNGHSEEAQELISESVVKLTSKKDFVYFFCDLIDAASDRKLEGLVFECYGRIKEIPFIGKRPFESMITGLSLMGMPNDAEKVFAKMGHSGFKPSGFEYRMIIQGYGRLGLFDEMRRVIEKMEGDGLGIDTVCANAVLSCYGDYGRLDEMVAWIRKMRILGIRFSVRTFNSVLNSCPSLVSMVQDLGTLPLSADELLNEMNVDEALLVQELARSSVLIENLKWSDSEGVLDLHGFHLAPAYVILLWWMEVLRLRFRLKGEAIVPLEISVVCGLGKHSIVRGGSPVKKLVSKLMIRLKSPMKIDRKNRGKFIAKGRVVRDWLC